MTFRNFKIQSKKKLILDQYFQSTIGFYEIMFCYCYTLLLFYGDNQLLIMSIDVGLLHGVLMSVSWFGLGNLAIWSLYFKQYYYAIYAHIASTVILSLFMIASALAMLVHTSFTTFSARIYHNGIGFIMIFIIPLILLSGSIARYSQTSPKTKSNKVYFNNKAHSVFGWVVILLSRVPLYTGFSDPDEVPSIIFLVIDALSFVIYLFLKFRPKTMSKISVPQPSQDQTDIQSISSQQQLNRYKNLYFIFADTVYSLDLILGAHPGGWRIINKIRNREVDRFIYGMQAVQLFTEDDSPYTHTSKSLNLAGDPIARINIPAVYQNMNMLNEVEINSLTKIHQNANVYMVYFESKRSNFIFHGYTHLSQIGQYYALTADEKITRLYTTVNFLTKTNFTIMQAISKQMKLQQSPIYVLNTQKSIASIEQMDKPSYFVPLMIKKYTKGNFTSNYIDKDFEGSFLLSKPRGFGLSMENLEQGQIVLFAAGTGIYPFSDLIDLLFKSMLIKQKDRHSSDLLKNDPLLNSDPFSRFTFSLYFAVNIIEELHPITLYQCNKLSEKKILKCVFKIKGASQKFKQQNKGIQITENRFEKFVQPWLRIRICQRS